MALGEGQLVEPAVIHDEVAVVCRTLRQLVSVQGTRSLIVLRMAV